MKKLSQSQLKTITFISLICLLVPLSTWALWIYAWDLGATQAERVAIFNNYVPDFLSGRYSKSLFNMAFCIAAITGSSMSMKLSGTLWKVLNMIILVISSLLLLLTLFSMM